MADRPWDWPLSWRIMILLNVSFFNMIGNVFTAGLPPLFELLIEDFHCTKNQAAHLTTYALLMLGLANLWAVPVVGYLGKRHTILTSLAVFLASNIWAATAQSYSSLLGTRFLGGLSGGAIEALGPFIVSECFAEKQLASAMVVYVGFLAAGSAVGPIVVGVLHPVYTAGAEHDTDDYPVDDAGQETKSAETSSHAEFDAQPTEIETQTEKERLWRIWKQRSFSLRIERGQHVENPLKLFFRPFPMLLVPEVFVTTLLFGLTIGWTVMTSVLVSNLYSMPPTLYRPWQIGCLNFGPLLGLLAGLPVGGALADLLSRKNITSHDGNHDPRSRLKLVILGGLISPTGCVVLGVSFSNHLRWPITVVGWGLLSFGLTASANILLTYSVDCHRSRAMDIGVLVNAVKNSIAFGVSYAAIEWHQKYGGMAQYGTVAGILWAVYLLIIPLYFFRDPLNKFSARFARIQENA